MPATAEQLSTPTRRRNILRRNPRAAGAVGAFLVMAGFAAGCGGKANAEEAVSPSFPVTQDWGKILPEFPQVTTIVHSDDYSKLQACFAQGYADQDGHRAPLRQTSPLVVTVDGSCNYPRSSDQVGVYTQPTQKSESVYSITDGKSLGVECATTGQQIRDDRGPGSESSNWVGVVNTEGQRGYVPVVNVGHVATAGLKPC